MTAPGKARGARLEDVQGEDRRGGKTGVGCWQEATAGSDRGTIPSDGHPGRIAGCWVTKGLLGSQSGSSRAAAGPCSAPGEPGSLPEGVTNATQIQAAESASPLGVGPEALGTFGRQPAGGEQAAGM